MSFCINDGVPDQIIVDAEALTRILDNLLSNSLEHTPAGGRIEVNVSTDKEKIYYTVTDTGAGFDAKDLKMHFINSIGAMNPETQAEDMQGLDFI